MLRFCQSIAGAMRSPLEQSQRVSTEFEVNSKWKATCVDLCQTCRLCCLKGKQPLSFISNVNKDRNDTLMFPNPDDEHHSRIVARFPRPNYPLVARCRALSRGGYLDDGLLARTDRNTYERFTEPSSVNIAHVASIGRVRTFNVTSLSSALCSNTHFFELTGSLSLFLV